MSLSFTDRVKVREDVLISGLDEESVILNLESERYFGLDNVGTRMLAVLSESSSIEKAFDQLAQEYDVDHEVLRRDMISLIDQLLEQGLVEITNA